MFNSEHRIVQSNWEYRQTERNSFPKNDSVMWPSSHRQLRIPIQQSTELMIITAVSHLPYILYIIHSPYILYVEEGAHIYDSLLSHLKLFLCGHRCRLTLPFFGLSDCRAVQTWMPTQPSGTGTPPTVQIPLNQNLSYLKLNNNNKGSVKATT